MRVQRIVGLAGCGAFAVAGTLGSLASCLKIAPDLGGLACEEGRCGGDYTCDPATNVCVTTGDACAAPSDVSACADGTVRVCDDGTWSACMVVGDECEPGSSSCDGDALVVCDGRGFVDEIRPCGAFGCNDQVAPQRCNACMPSTTSCVGLVFTTCSADGLIANEQSCDNGRVCSGAWTCHPTNGCVPGAVAADGTPCDEDDGFNGNFCDSSCRGQPRTCEPVAPTCDDGNSCTDDACLPATGCSFVPLAAGTACGAPGSLCESSCDAAHTCTSADVDCEAIGAPCGRCNNATGLCDQPVQDGRECRGPTDLCDAAESCNGSDVTCPADLLADAGTVCRAAQDPICDVAEQCSGSSAACPTDVFADGVVCHAATDECDLAELCSGGTCTAQDLKNEGALCNQAGGGAVNDTCTAPDRCDAAGVCQPNHVPGNPACSGCGAASCICQHGVCEADNPTLELSASCISAAPCTVCTLTIGLGSRAGAASDIDCTAPRQALLASDDGDRIADFSSGSWDGWSANNLSLFNWPGAMPGSCPTSGAGAYFHNEQSGTLTRTVDARGYRNVEVRFHAGYDDGGDAPDAGEHITINECCGNGCTNWTAVGTVPNGAEGGADGCSMVTSPSFTSTNCQYLRAQFAYSNSGTGTEYATLDDIAMTGEVIFAPVTGDNGTYTSSVTSCVPQQYDVTCTWTGGTTPSVDVVNVTFP